MNAKYLLNTNILANDRTLEFFSSRVICQHCGNCCSGILFKWVHLHEGDGPRLARGIAMDLKEFYEQYCGQENYQTYLKFPCPFLEVKPEGASCRVYQVRGKSCRMFPVAKLGNKNMLTIGIDLRCPAGAELAEEFKRENSIHSMKIKRN
jgi:Fe-S-cluster containining protein